jgi:hypothetical protein
LAIRRQDRGQHGQKWRWLSVMVENGIGRTKGERGQHKVGYGGCDNVCYRGEHGCRCEERGRGMAEVAREQEAEVEVRC